MSTADAARENSRQRNGRFGPQARSEPDPANAGLSTLEAPILTWDAALAHAEVLREQGVHVRVDKDRRRIEFRDHGVLRNPDDGTPAVQEFHPDGSPKWIEHWPHSDPSIGDLLEREIRLSDAFSREHPGFGLLLSQEGNIITVSVGDNDDMASIEVDVVVRPSDTEESLDRKVMDEAREALRRARVVFGGAQ